MSLQWYDEKANNPPLIDALAELRQRATRVEGYCYGRSRRVSYAGADS